MLPLWFFLGWLLALPWGWYLMVPVLLWYAGYMLLHRRRHRLPPKPAESLRETVERSLAELDPQIRLLRSVFWWGLLPFLLACIAFFLQVALSDGMPGWWSALVFTLLTALVTVVLGWLYWLNQHVVRTQLIPRRQELEALLAGLQEETPAAAVE